MKTLEKLKREKRRLRVKTLEKLKQERNDTGMLLRLLLTFGVILGMFGVLLMMLTLITRN
jgi:hypothetical protein